MGPRKRGQSAAREIDDSDEMQQISPTQAMLCETGSKFMQHVLSVVTQERRGGRLSPMGRSAAIRTDVRIDGLLLRVLLVRPESRCFAKAAIWAFVFPGVNNESVPFEVVIRTGEFASVALGAIAYLQTFARHTLADKCHLSFAGGRARADQPSEQPTLGNVAEIASRSERQARPFFVVRRRPAL